MYTLYAIFGNCYHFYYGCSPFFLRRAVIYLSVALAYSPKFEQGLDY